MDIEEDDRKNYDTPWKNILETYFQDFMAMCHPVAYAQIDWTKKYEVLDKELRNIIRHTKTGKRLVDKLIKVHLKTGKDLLVLIHVEVQGLITAS